MHTEWKELLIRDHEIAEQVFDAGQKAFEQEAGPSRDMVGKLLKYFVEYADRIHNHKEEDHLFPLIEERGVPRNGGPLAVMLAEHEQSRQIMEKFGPLATDYADGKLEDFPELKKLYFEYTELLKGHYWKENDILYPMAERVMSPEDGQKVLEGIHTIEATYGENTRETYYALADEIIKMGEVKDLIHNLDLDTIGAIFNKLPIEISFVDANDKVRYFSHENQEKIFPRTRGSIGMAVQSCHPQKSVHMVDQILEDFRAGKREVAEFWIDFGPKMVHIRYWPIFDKDGKYEGTLEGVQDVTGIRALEGQRRILDEA
ncbi:DUF438 domain-containing protein [Myxococcota bacterium]|nr:DUF438 domain-containing protein [Myxococcota bacterium]